MFRRILLSTVGLVLMIALAIQPTATARSQADPLDGAGKAEIIHPDCLDDHQPRQCTRLVNELTAELERFNEVFADPDPDKLATFYHEDAILYVVSSGRFFRGRSEIRNDFFVPIVAGIKSATGDISAFRFQVNSPNLIVTYGSPTATVTFSDGSTVRLPPLPQTLTWVRQGGDRSQPFVILTDHE
jgi:hypothetical protein